MNFLVTKSPSHSSEFQSDFGKKDSEFKVKSRSRYWIYYDFAEKKLTQGEFARKIVNSKRNCEADSEFAKEIVYL